MMDVGLSPGVLDLWQQELLLDYTLEVEGREFKVHKVILASVSDYFKAMLGGSMRESTTDRVVLKGLSAHGVSKTIDVIYTGDEEIVAAHAVEILKCAIYFQIPKVIEACTDSLMHDIDAENCFEKLSMFEMFQVQYGIQKVMKFMMNNWQTVSNCLSPRKMPLELVQIFLDLWELSEMSLFQFVKAWVEVDYKKRNGHVNHVMSQVRFCLMSPEEISSVKKMDIHSEYTGAWCELVDEAADHHKLPMYQKVLVNSKQNRVRSDPRLVILPMDNKKPALVLDKTETHWKEIENLKVGPSLHQKPIFIEVNDFLILHSILNDDEDDIYWGIFDPRTSAWSRIASTEDKFSFGLVYHNEHLYMLGGSLPNDEDPTDIQENELSDDVVEYSFKTNTWHTINKMPAPVTRLAACVFGDHIYVSGGERKVTGVLRSVTADLDCLDMTTSTWHKKAPMTHVRKYHTMDVMKLRNVQVILVIDNELRMEYYTPGSDQWSVFKHSFCSKVLQPSDSSRTVTFKGDSVFIFDIFGSFPEERACVKWDFSDDEIHEVVFPDYGELEPYRYACNVFGVLVSMIL